ncbi:MAG: carnitine 3-dehydrogenase [Hyphomicrobiales bacterium]|nr:carnitine 3-dehydrogenase [Hyphomicrobiales bacterium]
MSSIKRCAVIGAGVIGAGWAARFVLNGFDVAIFDPHPDAERRARATLDNAMRARERLTLAPMGELGGLSFVATLAEAVRDADFVQENAPEREELKRELLRAIDAHARPTALIASSTSGLLPSRLQAGMDRPGRFFVGHPFNPVYLLPLVELCGGSATDPATIDAAHHFYASLGMHPLRLRKEIDGFVADRLLEALWREALWLVQDDVATVAEVDDAIRYGAGLRWAFMGTFLTYRLAGGEAGMRHFLAQFGPALQLPWTKLMDVPELTPDFIEKLAAQSEQQAAGASLEALERKRDDCLIAIMQALRAQDFASGKTLAQYEERLFAKPQLAKSGTASPDISKPLRLHEGVVRTEWIDYNNHLTESRYLQVFGDASDALTSLLGVDAAYRRSNGSFFTAETHMIHLREIACLEPFFITTQILHGDEKRIHLFHVMHHARTNEPLASGEQMLLHVDAKTGRVSPASPEVRRRLASLTEAQAKLPLPQGAGRAIQKRK